MDRTQIRLDCDIDSIFVAPYQTKAQLGRSA